MQSHFFSFHKQLGVRIVCTMKRRRALLGNSKCLRCDHAQQVHEMEISAIYKKMEEKQYIIDELTQKCANLEQYIQTHCDNHIIKSFNGSVVKSEEFSASHLILNNFESYFTSLLHKYPVLNFVVEILLSITHVRKVNSKSTSSQWLQWAALYKSFILEVVLRSKHSKSTFRTPMLLALICTYGNVSEPVWNVLRTLCIICSRAKLQSWMKEQPLPPISDDNVLLFSFDNCDFYKHVTNVRSNHRNTMVHIATQLVADFGAPLSIAVSDIWHPVQKPESSIHSIATTILRIALQTARTLL